MNTRRRLVISLGACASVPGTVFAQAKKPPVVIGWLSAGLRPEAGGGNLLAEVKKELATLGWQEGANYVLEELYAAGQLNRLPALAEEARGEEAGAHRCNAGGGYDRCGQGRA